MIGTAREVEQVGQGRLLECSDSIVVRESGGISMEGRLYIEWARLGVS